MIPQLQTRPPTTTICRDTLKQYSYRKCATKFVNMESYVDNMQLVYDGGIFASFKKPQETHCRSNNRFYFVLFVLLDMILIVTTTIA